MNKYLALRIYKYSKDAKRKKLRQKIMIVLSIAVACCTLYALIMPAITLEKQTICKADVHTHTEECYSDVTTPEYFTMSEIHQHKESCYSDGVLTCDYTYTYIHSHNEYCYNSLGALVCPFEEIIEHNHNESCFALHLNMICTQEEDYHVHNDSCFKIENGELICALEETEGHQHVEECYQIISTEIICQAEEIVGHAHGEECYCAKNELICQLEETDGHVHSEECKSTEKTLGCQIAEDECHTHTDECYILTETMICALAEAEPHTHTETCYGYIDDLICEIPEIPPHTHSTECYQYNKALICDEEEIQPHVHKTDCYRQIQTVICEKEEKADGHAHTEQCYEESKNLICTEDEIMLHSHTEECYCENGTLVCDLKEVLEHSHNENCTTFVQQEEKVMTCNLEEHTHTDECYPPEQQQPEVVQLIHQGEDYTVTVKYDSQATIPENAVLFVQEISPESSEYLQYIRETHNIIEPDEENELQTEITFARFFDISFIVDGEEYEPLAPVEISITYTNAVEFTEDSSVRAVHFAQEGIEVLEARINETDNKADTFTFTQDSFSVTGTVVIGKAINTSNMTNMSEKITSIDLFDSKGAVSDVFVNNDTVSLKIDAMVYGWEYWAHQNNDITLYYNIPDWLDVTDVKVTGAGKDLKYYPEDKIITVVAPFNNHADILFQVELIGKIINTSSDTLNINFDNKTIYVYKNVRKFDISNMDGISGLLKIYGSELSSDDYQLVVEAIDDSYYESPIKSYIQSQYQGLNLKSSAIYNIYLQNRSNASVKQDITAPYELLLFYSKIPFQIETSDNIILVDLSKGNAEKPKDGNIEKSGDSSVKINITNSTDTIKSFAIVSLGSLKEGTTNSGYSLKYNYEADSFLKDPVYSKYYNDNSPIGTAGSFHIVAFDTANLGTHTNGNVLAKNLVAGSNFGTNNYPEELTYAQNYIQVHNTSASSEKHVLVVGSNNVISSSNNSSQYRVNGKEITKPKALIVDVDTENTPFIDLNRVKNEIEQISANLRQYSTDQNIILSENGDNNVFSLTEPNTVGFINVKYNADKIFQKNIIQFSGFESGHDGTIVINVDCSGTTAINMPQAYVVVDGQQQGTNEVTEFSAGKVLWNFINAEGVIINTHLMTGMIIAPGATVNIKQNLNGTVVANNVNVQAESHRTDFTGRLVMGEAGEETSTTTYITVQKTRTGYIGTVLADARFDLYEWYNNTWVKVNNDNIVTKSNGLVTINGIKKDTAYRLIETQAPVGYIISDDHFDFWVRSSKNMTAPSRRPSGFAGKALDATNVMNVPNEMNTAYSATSISIEKQWISDYTRTSDSVTVDIYQIKMVEGEEVGRELYSTINLTQEDNWKITLNNLPITKKDSSGNIIDCLYTVVEQPVENFNTTYSENNISGIIEGTILITNTEISSGYELPETGGSGEKNYVLNGMFFITGAVMVLFYRKLEKEKV